MLAASSVSIASKPDLSALAGRNSYWTWPVTWLVLTAGGAQLGAAPGSALQTSVPLQGASTHTPPVQVLTAVPAALHCTSASTQLTLSLHAAVPLVTVQVVCVGQVTISIEGAAAS